MENNIKVAITHGDFNGIGYEVIIKTFLNNEMLDLCTPIVYGSSKLASYHNKAIGANRLYFNIIKSPKDANSHKVNIINIVQDEVKVELGTSSAVAGELSFLSLEKAIEDMKNGLVDVIVTAPINKDNIQSKDFSFPGHTEYLGEKFQVEDELMFLVSRDIRVGVLTGHIPISAVSNVITKELIISKIKLMSQSLKRDFGIRKPKIAVLGLNPHSGDNGIIGREEMEVHKPAIEALNESGELVYGPFSSDGFFASGNYKAFDAVMANYHDQGLIPFKVLSFNDGVNFTAGLPIVRTSPDHGTAYEIAGKGIADPASFRSSIYLALDVFRNRKTYDEINENPLPLPVANNRNQKDEKINPFSENLEQ